MTHLLNSWRHKGTAMTVTQKRRVMEWAIQNQEIATLRAFIEENQADFLMKAPLSPNP
jgi:hypothetical protein